MVVELSDTDVRCLAVLCILAGAHPKQLEEIALDIGVGAVDVMGLVMRLEDLLD